jgi:hypothetical protein
MTFKKSAAIAGLMIAAACAAAPAAMADAKVDAAVKAFDGVAADPAKLKTFCEMSKAMAGASDEQDEKKAAALESQLEGYMKTLGPDFKTAWDSGADLDPDSADGKTMNAALDKLEGKCEK